MIYLQERYAPCLKALEDAGLLEWDGNRVEGYDEGRYRLSLSSGREGWPWQFDLFGVGTPRWYHDEFVDNHVAECILERAARMWLADRRIYLAVSWDAIGGRPYYVALRGHTVLTNPIADHAECQLEAMLAIIEEEKQCAKSK